jgi:hypothetical protein
MMVLLFFSILGLTLFVGNTNYTCRQPSVPSLTDLDTKFWTKIPTPEYVCTPAYKHVFGENFVDYAKCPSDFGQDSICESVLNYDLSEEDDGINTNA